MSFKKTVCMKPQVTLKGKLEKMSEETNTNGDKITKFNIVWEPRSVQEELNEMIADLPPIDSSGPVSNYKVGDIMDLEMDMKPSEPAKFADDLPLYGAPFDRYTYEDIKFWISKLGTTQN